MIKICDPHGTNKTNGTPYADRRESFHNIEAIFFESNIRHRVDQSNGGHIDHCIQQHDQVHCFKIRNSRCPQEQASSHKMTGT